MAGIYIHIPYCRKKCFYCDFYSITNFTNKNNLISSIIKEIELRSTYLNNELIETIYFGGGTPSVLSNIEINNIYNSIINNFDIAKNLEFTFEANPDDLSLEYLKLLKTTKINRLSIGIQSLFDDDLILMNRRHTAIQAIDAIKNAKDIGFNNISVDLIYGLPKMTQKRWIQNLDKVFELDIQHISAYHLTYEKGTKFYNLLKNNKLTEISELESINEYKLLLEKAKNNNFIQYEISNFCKENYYSKHNSNYWNNKKYLGIGPSAHSYNLCSRQWNISDINKYIYKINQQEQFYDIEILSDNDKYNDYIITKLRTTWGVNIESLTTLFDKKYVEHFLSKTKKFIASKHIISHFPIIKLSNNGILISDKIIEELLFID